MVLKVILISIYGICAAGMFFCLYKAYGSTKMMERNDAVSHFRISTVLFLSIRYNKRREKEGVDYKNAFEWFLGKYTYESMLYSDKPLTLEEWYTEEELKEISRQ